MQKQPESIFDPRPDCERLSNAELQEALADADERLRLWHEAHPEKDPDLDTQVTETWLVQERRMILAELARRNGRQPGTSGQGVAIMRRVSEIGRHEVSWLWQDRIPRGKLGIIEGDPGLGKSWLTLAIAAAVSRGLALPGDAARKPHNVVLLNAEDGPEDTIRPRLEDMEADLGRIVLLEGAREDGKERAVTLADLDVIEAAILEHKPALVVIDPLVAYTARADTHVAAEVRGLLAPLAGLAERHRVAVVAVRHLTKANGVKTSYRGQGSIDFLAACRSAFLVAEHPEDPAARVLAHIKCNLAAKAPSLTFSISQGCFVWGAETNLSAEQLLAQPVAGEERSEQDAAQDFLRQALAGGGLPSRELVKQAREAGISERTLWRAKTAMKVKPEKASFAGGWLWRLPTEPNPAKPANFANSSNVAALASFDGWEEV